MFCMNCGEPLGDDVKFCPHCGTKVDWAAFGAVPAAPVEEKNEDKPAAEEPSTNGFTLGESKPAAEEPVTTGFTLGGSEPTTTGFTFGDSKPAAEEPVTTGFTLGDSKPAVEEPSTTGFTLGDSKPVAEEPSTTGFTFGDSKPAAEEPTTTGFTPGDSKPAAEEPAGADSPFAGGVPAGIDFGGPAKKDDTAAKAGAAAAAGLGAAAVGAAAGSGVNKGSQSNAGWNPFKPVDPGKTQGAAGSGPSYIDYSAGPAMGQSGSGAGNSSFSGFDGDGPDDDPDKDRINPLGDGPMTLEKVIHIGSGFVGFVPLAMFAVGFIFSILLGVVSGLGGYGLWRAVSGFRQVIMVLVMLVALAEFGGILYMVATKKVKQEQGMIITLGVAVLTAIYAILRVSNSAGGLRFILFVACTVLGIDLLARFLTFGTALRGGFDLKGSAALLMEKAGLNKSNAGAARGQGAGSFQGNADGFQGNANSFQGNAGGFQRNAAAGMAGAAAAGAAAAGMAGAAAGAGDAQGAGAYRNNPPIPYDGQPEGGSYFDGQGVDLFVNMLLLVLASMFTCGIAAPWFICRIYKWRLEHTVIDGKRLTFNGTGGELLGKWIIWEILTVITCGLFGFYVYVSLKKWELSHTAYMGAPETAGMVYPNSFFDGPFSSYLGYSILCGLVTALTCGIAYPWAAIPLINWEMGGSVVEGDRLSFVGRGSEMFVIYLVNGLLTVVTCGIYGPWATCRLNRYIIGNTHVM